MVVRALFSAVLFTVVCLPGSSAHPGGNLTVAGDYIMWTYVYPLEDSLHRSSVMIWSPDSPVRPLITSRHVSSDFFLYAEEDTVYYVETRNSQESNQSFFRVLKGRAGERPDEIWPWREDRWRVGRSGFYMLSDYEMIFSRYPDLHTLKKGAEPETFMTFLEPVNRLRKLNEGRLLLLSDTACWLLNSDYKVIRKWDEFIQRDISDAPLNMNKAFDMDYGNGVLVLAYWGNRSFLVLDADGNIEEVMRLETPYTAHWVAVKEKDIFLFGSEINPPSPIRPKLLRVRDGAIRAIWEGE